MVQKYLLIRKFTGVRADFYAEITCEFFCLTTSLTIQQIGLRGTTADRGT